MFDFFRRKPKPEDCVKVMLTVDYSRVPSLFLVPVKKVVETALKEYERNGSQVTRLSMGAIVVDLMPKNDFENRNNWKRKKMFGGGEKVGLIVKLEEFKEVTEEPKIA
jgi:hypothetical protein